MTPRPIRHRRARRTDLDAIRTLLADSGLPMPDADRGGLRRFRRLVADLGGDLDVAVIDERLVGLVHVTYARHLLHGQQARLAFLIVAGGERRKGIGRALAERAAERARRRGCSSMQCDPAAAANDTPAFLAALGWRAGGAQFEFDLPGSRAAQ